LPPWPETVCGGRKQLENSGPFVDSPWFVACERFQEVASFKKKTRKKPMAGGSDYEKNRGLESTRCDDYPEIRRWATIAAPRNRD